LARWRSRASAGRLIGKRVRASLDGAAVTTTCSRQEIAAKAQNSKIQVLTASSPRGNAIPFSIIRWHQEGEVTMER
jgi:hypothetical protein